MRAVKNLLVALGGAALVMGCTSIVTSPSQAAATSTQSLKPVDSTLETPRVLRTSFGTMKGRTDGEISTFQGIPYALAPIGDRRWKAPVPHPGLEGTFEASSFGASCMQRARSGPFPDPRPMSEDCLSLNVWAPEAGGGPKPVIVWIHGGAFVLGSSNFPYYDGEAFARSGTVFVSINYRLGRFGFFAHPAVREETNVTNFGYLDQVAALRWIKEHITSFGGDPNNVTIVGESAGGVSVTHLLSMPDAQGLFHKAIVESGSGHRIEPQAWKRRGNRPGYDDQGTAWSEMLGLGGRKADVAAMRALPAAAVLGGGGAPSRATPAIDGVTVKTDVATAFERKQQAAVPLLIGATSFEGSLATNMGTRPRQILALLGRRVEEARRAYAEIGFDLDDEALAYQAYGDATFVTPARYLARQMARRDVPVWLYHFDVVPEGRRATSPGSPHGGEIPYVFDLVDRLDSIAAAAGPSDRQTAALMHKAWVAFAFTGDPRHQGLQIWEPVTKRETPTLVVTASGVTSDPAFEKPVHDFFDDRFQKLRRLFPLR